MSPRAWEGSAHPRLRSGASGRPLNFTARSRALIVLLTQALSVSAKLVAGVLLLMIGSGAALSAAMLLVALLRDFHATHDPFSFEATMVVGLLAPCGVVFCAAGYRLLLRRSEAQTMHSRSSWLALCIFFNAWATFGLGALVFAPSTAASTITVVVLSSLVMSAFSVSCYLARHADIADRRGAASNNRWSGP